MRSRPLAVLGLLAVAGCTVARAQNKKGVHGETPIAEQLPVLDKLGLGKSEGVPAGVDAVIWASLIPADNQMSEIRVTLGRKLYFDTRLSADNTVACATCHDVLRGFTDQRPLSEGIGGKVGRRNAPTTANAALLGTQFWDGRAATLEQQAILPIVNPIEMGMKDGAAAVAAIKDDPEYQRLFEAAYGRAPNYEDIGRALASFERTLIFLDAPFDQFVGGKKDAISEAAAAGFRLFNGKARCVTCHPISVASPLGTDNRFHNIGVSARAQDFDKLARQALDVIAKGGGNEKEEIDRLALETDMSQLGRFLVSKSNNDMGAFRTSQLRNIGLTAPYMHDGTLQTLWDVMDHYNKGGEPHFFLDGGIEPLALTEEEINQLVEFMFTLTDRRFDQANQAAFASQLEASKTKRPFRNEERAQRKTIGFTP